MAQDFSQEQSIRQEQTLSARQIQSLAVLAAPAMELRGIIDRELSENPVLEEVEPDDSAPEPTPEETPDPVDPDDDLTRLIEYTAAGMDSGDAMLPEDHSGSDSEEELRDFLLQSIPDSVSMQENLLGQLRMMELDPQMHDLCEAVIGSIDDSGYLTTHPADIAMGGNCSLEKAEEALKIVQGFDPPGVGARDLKECLILQLDPKDPDFEDLKTLIQEHLDDLAANRIPKIAAAMELPQDALDVLISKLKKLNPTPGGALAHHAPQYVEPEVVIQPEGDHFKITGGETHLPRLRISKHYMDMLEDPNTPADAKNYIKTKIAAGSDLIKALENRESTIRRIAAVVAEEQYDFLREGVDKLRPMTMKQVADKLGIHETTVSRAVKDKFIATPQGVLEFKKLFSNGFRSGDGEEISAQSVKEQIRELIEDENPAKPLSDAALTDLLAEKGMNIKRRTVAKYREELGIRASHLRKVFP